MKNEALVTVNILSYNRIADLQHTLKKVFEQDYKNIEVIVVDNASSDGSTDMIKTYFPTVKLIQLKNNIGIAGWNKGFEAARGEFILMLDDDSFPVENSILKAVECINSDKKIGVACLKVYNETEKRYETGHINKKEPNTFIGCGALIRKSILKETGYFNELLFLYEHETEFSMRVYNSGFIIKYCESSLVNHCTSLSNRNIKNKSDYRRKYFISRNYIIILLLHFSLYRIMIFLPQLVFARMLMSIIEKTFFITLKGISDGFIRAIRNIKTRSILSKEVQKFYNYGNYMGRFVRDKRY